MRRAHWTGSTGIDVFQWRLFNAPFEERQNYDKMHCLPRPCCLNGVPRGADTHYRRTARAREPNQSDGTVIILWVVYGHLAFCTELCPHIRFTQEENEEMSSADLSVLSNEEIRVSKTLNPNWIEPLVLALICSKGDYMGRYSHVQ